MKLVNQINQLENYIPKADITNSSVSARGVDWHIDHILKVINVSLNVLKKSNEEDYKWSFNLYKSVFLTVGTFPRNRVRAPKVVNNKADILKGELEIQISEAKLNCNEIKDLPAKSNFKHPFFGVLTKKETIRFLEVHTNHHIKIIKRILKK